MTDDDLRKVRAAQNQALFRIVNSQIVRLNESFERVSDRSVFVCECAHMDCVQEIAITLSDYARVRKHPARFVVAPSEEHVVPEVELVVERHDGYYVVEKIGVGAEVAAETAAVSAPVRRGRR